MEEDIKDYVIELARELCLENEVVYNLDEETESKRFYLLPKVLPALSITNIPIEVVIKDKTNE